MRQERFSDHSPGSLVPITLHRKHVDSSGKFQIEPVNAVSFVPDPLPPKIDWREIKADLFDELTAARAALARVNGLIPLAPNTRILRQALWLREAKLSSEIENIHTTALDMVMAGSRGTDQGSDKALEAWNATKAVRLALESELPFSGRLIRKMHEALLVGVRGEDQRPGEYRDSPVYIGSPDKPENARFVPPPPGDMPGQVIECMDRLERFANAKHADIPELASVALVHYQFEAIHPFRDGNGRIGRALILHQLCARGILELPVVSASGYFQKHRQEYIDRMFAVSTDGDWAGWIRFFSEAVAAEAVQTRLLAERLVSLHRGHVETLKSRGAPTRLLDLLDHIYDWPVVNAKSVASLLGVTDPTARKDISTMEDIGALRITDEVAYGKAWYAPDVLAVIEARSADEDK